MANHASAEKAHRQGMMRQKRNRGNRSELRTALKRFSQQLKNEEVAIASDSLTSLYSIIDKAARKKALTKNAAARQKSRLSRRFNAKAPKEGKG